MQNWDFFETNFGLWSYLGPSPKFGTSLERLVAIAHDLKPDKFSNNMGFTELQDWITRATVYSQASGISMQSHSVQLAYLQALIAEKKSASGNHQQKHRQNQV